MRNWIVLAVRTLIVLALVVGLPLLALPPVRERVSDWTAEFRRNKRVSFRFAELRAGHQRPQNVQTADTGICWQARPAANSSAVAGSLEAVSNVTPFSLQKPSLPKREKPPTQSVPTRTAANPKIQVIQEDLIQRGAQQMRLEEVAGQPATYHFSCLMPVNPRAVYCRQFATTDSDPIRAMQWVLDEVKRWQSSRPNL